MVKRTAKDFGYAYYPDELPPVGYQFVEVGQKIQSGDIYFTQSGWWLVPDTEVGLVIHAVDCAIARRVVESKPRWSCRHLRLEKDTRCPICAVLRYKDITD